MPHFIQNKLASPVFLTFILALVAMPLAIMSTQSVPSPLFYFLLVLSLFIVIALRPAQNTFRLKTFSWLFALCAVFVVAVVVSELVNGRSDGAGFEKALRFSAGLPLLVAACCYVPRRWLSYSVFGVYAALVFAIAFIVVLALPDFIRPETSAVYNAVGYGDLTFLLSVITLYSCNVTFTRFARAEKILKILLGLLGIAAFVLTQTRSGWVAVPFFLLFGIMIHMRENNRMRLAGVFLLGLVLAAAVTLTVPGIKDRVQLGEKEFTECITTDSTKLSSICIRLQLWRSTVAIWEENPLFGSGANKYFSEFMKTEGVQRGLVSEVVANQWGEPHNDWLQALSSYGLFGVLGLFLVYFAPAAVFVKRMLRTTNEELRTYAAMGAAVCVGFAVFGLSELMFRGLRTMGFYTVIVAVYLALSTRIRGVEH
ncbi:putative O-antigen polymerase [Advenella kashmirensis WT001]|uniref:Putative O-antigen polymerase n=1 Tax=Advenella kashmirensis (strain DSM 17095 / LMG 22695 / WT001) TaxID=1036672 RepID=I3U8U8_ADVKW|nr:O-antigen ligase family protein [Advenella kashmirensis]AFK61436.1 putative O-antigen polymerase [Advenella kashmirensis WT001]